jgi:uncharacterized protein YdhG (YjbR/CyaY superfamily)
MADNTPTSIDDYISRQPEGTQEILQEMRRRIRAVVPDAGEKISYQIPTLTVGGKNFVHFAGWAKYVSMYPVPSNDEQLAKDLAPFQASKGTLKFPLDQPVPYDLVERVAAALAESRLT